MTKSDQIKILNEKIKSNNSEYNIDRLNAEISAFSEGDLDKYEFLTRKDLKYKPNALNKVKFEFSPLGKGFNQGLDKKARNFKEEGVIKLLKDIRDNMIGPIGGVNNRSNRNNRNDGDDDGNDNGDDGNDNGDDGNDNGDDGSDGSHTSKDSLRLDKLFNNLKDNGSNRDNDDDKKITFAPPDKSTKKNRPSSFVNEILKNRNKENESDNDSRSNRDDDNNDKKDDNNDKEDDNDKKINVSLKTFQELGKKLFELSNEHDKIKEIKTSDNLIKKVIHEVKELLKTTEKNDELNTKAKDTGSIGNLLKEMGVDPNKDDTESIGDLLKEINANEAQRASKK